VCLVSWQQRPNQAPPALRLLPTWRRTAASRARAVVTWGNRPAVWGGYDVITTRTARSSRATLVKPLLLWRWRSTKTTMVTSFAVTWTGLLTSLDPLRQSASRVS
jgi:hypothetical protein